MSHLPKNLPDANLIVGLDTSDDAGVYKLTDDVAIVQTVDYFTPIVDDPYMFGAIAAANALSDVYAMGGKPLTVLNIVGFPVSKLDKKILAEILRGGADKVREAGAVIVGGHSIDDSDPKFGMAVTGIVHPEKVWTNAGACPGDKLVLTKPIGVGIVTTAIKRAKATPEAIRQVESVMATLNKVASETAQGFTVHACTDITGFGLLGHAAEMARGACVGIEIDAKSVPMLPDAYSLAEQGIIPGGSLRNYEWLADDLEYAESIDEVTRKILCDAVTSGGLLLSVPAEEADALVEALKKNGVEDAVVIGRVVEEHSKKIRVM
ncbi:selenophosphate synthetase [Effusibacillus lacus]|uniref:Selenide, water dikinase n=1 Tax=Effusibacillus lacus TaxID=1348429 RepID=A0A292YLD3_9BACL|nr:selenophosphate synthase [Effusibacillus lacus]GAX89976.1 selenophosphate synthetase [Effusibacillus lacus]